MLYRWVILVVLLICGYQAWLILPTLAASEQPAEEHVALELVSEQDALVPGKDLWVGIRLSLKDGFHTYWVNPGDSGEAPRIEWHLPSELKAGAIQWPQPERLLNPPFADYGYEYEVLLMVMLSPSPGLKKGQDLKLGAGVRYLICREVCIPGRKQLDLTIPVKDRASATSTSELFEFARHRLPRPAPAQWKLTAAEGSDEVVLTLTTKDAGLAPQFFPLIPEEIENAAPQKVTTKPGGIRLHLIKSKHLLKPVSRLQGVLVVAPGRAYQVNVPVSQPSQNSSPAKKSNI